MSTIEAPVVPIHEAMAVPINNRIKFAIGVPAGAPFTRSPPEIVKRDHNKMMKGMYSNR